MKPLSKTLKLLAIASVASIGFIVIFLILLDREPQSEQAMETIFLLMPIALAAEVGIYKLFLKDWRDVLANYLIAHAAYFFASVAGGFAYAAELSDERVILAWLLVWLPTAYLGQYHIIYVERLEARLEKQQQEIKDFEKKRLQLTKQMTSLQGRIQNQKRWIDQHKTK
ncbi:hypothetical protein [[Limnothrix rosea] IAM M-220]|uniref:hypothetical protein n=1 Tax=[Limnothrix rosea] IAM M-220 TaxID=454133 RepID=UPI000967C9FF|nr:hypothetical protein [[Limnothrix rosea] IAM M-220]OKH19521.1 hypothetical protein NIES208_01565 [[Limnothrix rosea] IAM M-220]